MWKDLNSFSFSTLNVGGVAPDSSEVITVAGGANASPSLSKGITLVRTTGSGTASGTLANGTQALHGYRKTIIAESIASGTLYALNVTSALDPATGVARL